MVGVVKTEHLLDPVVAAYRRRLERYGAHPMGVIWRNEDRQESRFAVLLDAITEDDRTRDISLNDLGCGYGALYGFVRDHTALRLSRYNGYDICPEMVAEAERRIGGAPGVHLETAMAATRKADYSIVSGTFNFKGSADDDEWDGYVKDGLRALWQKSARGMAFNMLSRFGAPNDGNLYLADPGEYVNFCLQRLSRHVVLRHDYMSDDFTVWVLR